MLRGPWFVRSLLTLALLLWTACGDARPSGSGNGNVTRQDVCDALVPASCSFRVRCGVFSGTQGECEASEADCCVGSGCSLAVGTTPSALEACASSVSEASCPPDGPSLSAECERLAPELLGETPRDAGGPPTDGGVGPDASEHDAGVSSPTGLYGFCDTDEECPGSQCVTVAAGGTQQRICSRSCGGLEPEDETCPGGYCIHIAVIEDGTYMSNVPYCLQSCADGGACPRHQPGDPGMDGVHLRCFTTLVSELDVCVP